MPVHMVRAAPNGQVIVGFGAEVAVLTPLI